MDLAKQVIVRYRADGHVRLQLPEALSQPPVAEHLAAQLRRIEGIYRVDLTARQRKLSIRFIEHICDFRSLAAALYRLIDAAEWTEPAASGASGETLPAVLRKRLKDSRPVRWLRGKLREGRETVTAMGIVIRREAIRQRRLSIANEGTVIQLLNDALVLYLIKLHWHLITQHWIRQPWRYRYEWMAASYMVYLLIRSRRSLR